MEHRCGTRFPMSLPVRLAVADWPMIGGRIENVSLSGALVTVAVEMPLWTRLEIELPAVLAQSRWVPAYVVRRTLAGVGLEWCEFAPRPVLDLLRREFVEAPWDGRVGDGSWAGARAERSGMYAR